ncbi:MAG: discoidin domain-containing protein, partial [Nitrososphaeraceae archaeon]
QATLPGVYARQTNNIVNTNSYYDIIFNTATTAAIKEIRVTFPAGTDVSIARLVEAEGIGEGAVGPGSIAGQTVTYFVKGAEVTTIPAGTQIRLELANIVNPSSPGNGYRVTVETRGTTNNIIDGPTQSFAYSIKQIDGGSLSCNNIPKLDVNSVIASGNDGNVPSNVIDNDFNTRWSNNGVGSWIQFDLGAKKSICSVDIGWYRGNTRQYDFGVSVSDDGTNFVNKFSGKSSGTATSLEQYNMPAGTEGRYVRVTVNGNTENDWASITEIAVFGSAPPPSSNQPPTADSKSVTTSMNTAVDITFSGKDPENGPLTFTVADLPKNGKVVAVAGSTNTVRYTPNTGFTGSDSFTYTAKDNKGAESAKATVSIS